MCLRVFSVSHWASVTGATVELGHSFRGISVVDKSLAAPKNMKHDIKGEEDFFLKKKKKFYFPFIKSNHHLASYPTVFTVFIAIIYPEAYLPVRLLSDTRDGGALNLSNGP